MVVKKVNIYLCNKLKMTNNMVELYSVFSEYERCVKDNTDKKKEKWVRIAMRMHMVLPPKMAEV